MPLSTLAQIEAWDQSRDNHVEEEVIGRWDEHCALVVGGMFFC